MMGSPSSRHNSFKAVMAVTGSAGGSYLLGILHQENNTLKMNGSEARYDQTLLNIEFHQNH